MATNSHVNSSIKVGDVPHSAGADPEAKLEVQCWTFSNGKLLVIVRLNQIQSQIDHAGDDNGSM